MTTRRRAPRSGTQFAVFFWDHDRWDERAGTRRRTRAEAAQVARCMNRETCHDERSTIFEGHRFRVMAVRED